MIPEVHAQDAPPALYELENIFGNLISVAIPFAGIILFFFVIIAGYKYITSGSDPAKAQAAQKTLTYAIFGVAVVALAFLILRIVAFITGRTDILFFEIYQR